MNRVRTKTAGVISNLDSIYKQVYNGKVTGYYSRPQDFSGVQKMTDVTTPGYFKTIRSGGVLPCNPCRIERPITAVRRVPGSVVYKKNSSLPYYSSMTGDLCFNHMGGLRGSFPTSLGLPALADASLGNSVALKAFANARQEAFDALTFLAELKETASMVTGVTRTLLKRISRLGSIKGSLATVSELWLEYRYGWRPLVSDLEALRDCVDRFNNKFYLVHGRASEGSTLSSSNTISPSSATWYWPNYGLSNPCYVVVSKKVTTQRSFRATSLVGLTPSQQLSYDPIATGWEIIPFSFVVDWFLNIQDNLLALSPFQLGTDLGLSLVQETTATMTLTSGTPVPIGGWMGTWQCVDSTPAILGLEQSVYDRVPFTPSLELSFQNPISNVNRIFDSIALSRKELMKVLRHINH